MEIEMEVDGKTVNRIFSDQIPSVGDDIHTESKYRYTVTHRNFIIDMKPRRVFRVVLECEDTTP